MKRQELHPVVDKVDKICRKILWKMGCKAIRLYCTLGNNARGHYRTYNAMARKEERRPPG